MSKLYVVGTGPGLLKHLTHGAREAVEQADVVVGYKTYLDLVAPLLEGKEVVSSGMMKEVERCRRALEIAAAGRTVALVSGGDSGIYGMAGLVLELQEEMPEAAKVAVEVLPGVSAVQAAASVLGAPLMHDFAVISLSDLLTSWELIRRRLAAAAGADFVVALYNPKSKGRVTQIEEARDIFLASRSPDTPVGIVRNACREDEEKVVTTLRDMLDHPIDMFTIVIIGNSATRVDSKGRMVTPRGYKTSSDFRVPGSRCKAENPEPGTGNVDQPGSGAVMIAGTGSDVGKSVLAAGLCRLLVNRGLSVAPFKAQNMANNSAVTPEGGEIGRAQAVQAEACRILPHVDMNPILLKPSSDVGSQVVVHGKPVGNMTVKEYHGYKPEALRKALESFGRLKAKHDFIVMEGAGSIAEINLKAHDIVNLRMAREAGAPVILVADIDRGGVFAQIVGTLEILEPAERAQVKGIIINKFRGDVTLLQPGIDFVEQRTGVPVLGVVPWLPEMNLPAEDSVAVEKRAKGEGRKANGKTLNIGVVKLPRISNFTDFDALEREPDVALEYISGGSLDHLDLLILPGSKATLADLHYMMDRGLFDSVRNFRGRIAGICGGYQMLGRRVLDPLRVESDIQEAEGLGLLDAETVMLPDKETHQAEALLADASAAVAPGCTGPLCGYEIHMGRTVLGPNAAPFATIMTRSGIAASATDGAVSGDGRVFGTYLHGIFDNETFRTSFLNLLRREKGIIEPARQPDVDPFNRLADHLERHLDMGRLLQICGIKQ